MLGEGRAVSQEPDGGFMGLIYWCFPLVYAPKSTAFVFIPSFLEVSMAGPFLAA